MVFTRETSRNDSLIKNSGDEDIKEELIQNNKNIEEENYVTNDQKSNHSQKGCKKPCNSQDRHLICMLVAIVLLVLAFMYLKISTQEIVQVK